jgi:hypothetical protein
LLVSFIRTSNPLRLDPAGNPPGGFGGGWLEIRSGVPTLAQSDG